VQEEIISRCIENNGKSGGNWGIGGTGGSQEYYEIDFISDGFQPVDNIDILGQGN